MTLDEASNIFDAAPSPMTAATLLRTGAAYFSDEMIDGDSFAVIAHQVADWLHLELAPDSRAVEALPVFEEAECGGLWSDPSSPGWLFNRETLDKIHGAGGWGSRPFASGSRVREVSP